MMAMTTKSSINVKPMRRRSPNETFIQRILQGRARLKSVKTVLSAIASIMEQMAREGETLAIPVAVRFWTKCRFPTLQEGVSSVRGSPSYDKPSGEEKPSRRLKGRARRLVGWQSRSGNDIQKEEVTMRKKP